VNEELYKTGKFETMSIEIDEDEHSIEMQLPYIAKAMERLQKLPFIAKAMKKLQYRSFHTLPRLCKSYNTIASIHCQGYGKFTYFGGVVLHSLV